LTDENHQARPRRDRRRRGHSAVPGTPSAGAEDSSAFSSSFDDEDIDLTGDLEDDDLPEGEISRDDEDDGDIELTDENLWRDDDPLDGGDSLEFQPGEESVPLDIEVAAPLLDLDDEPAIPTGSDAIIMAPTDSRASLDPDEDLDPFTVPPSTEPGAAPPDVPIINPYAEDPPVTAATLDLDLEIGPPMGALPGPDAAPRTLGDDDLRFDDDDDGVAIDSLDDDDEVGWLQAEARRLEVEDRIDEELSLLDQLTRLMPGDEAIATWYEDILARVIHVYFPGKTPESVPVLTVEAWELPDLIRDPVMGTILSRMDGITNLRELYSAMTDQDPGTIYRLLSRAKGKGLVRLDDVD
jgi:hypothetical protein